MIVTVITPTIRPAGALRAAESVRAAAMRAPQVDVRHLIAHWTAIPDPSRERLAPWLTNLIADATGWIVACDDDNLLHPDLFAILYQTATTDPLACAVAFGQKRRDHGGYLPPRLPPQPGRIDGGQVALHRDYAIREPWRSGSHGDGLYLAALYQHNPGGWAVIDQPLTYHNAQEWM